MTNAETIFIVLGALLLLLIEGNIAFSFFAEWRNPPIGQFLDSGGARLHYIDRGDRTAPCVVLFHGNGSMMQDLTLSNLVDLLARQYRVICFGRPGFGHSQRPRLQIWTATAQAALFAKALNELGVRNPVVFGHSWGTLVAIALGLRDDSPRTCACIRVLLSDCAMGRLDDVGTSHTHSGRPSSVYRRSHYLRGYSAQGRKLFSPRSVPPEFKNEFPRSLTLRPKQLRAAAEESALLVPAAAQFQSSYGRIQCPVRIFHGTDDAIIESKQAQDLQRVLGGRSKLHLIQNAGHMVTYAKTAAIAEAFETVGGLVSRRTALGGRRAD